MTKEPIFLTLADVMEMHLYQLEHFGGSPGLRDMNLLKSAIAMPQMSFGGIVLHKNIFEMAAAYLFHVVENHPFLDGNKRTGAMAAIVFLDVNGMDFEATDDDFAEMVLQVASGRMGKQEVAAFLKGKCSPQARREE